MDLLEQCIHPIRINPPVHSVNRFINTVAEGFRIIHINHRDLIFHHDLDMIHFHIVSVYIFYSIMLQSNFCNSAHIKKSLREGSFCAERITKRRPDTGLKNPGRSPSPHALETLYCLFRITYRLLHITFYLLPASAFPAFQPASQFAFAFFPKKAAPARQTTAIPPTNRMISPVLGAVALMTTATGE